MTTSESRLLYVSFYIFGSPENLCGCGLGGCEFGCGLLGVGWVERSGGPGGIEHKNDSVDVKTDVRWLG